MSVWDGEFEGYTSSAGTVVIDDLESGSAGVQISNVITYCGIALTAQVVHLDHDRAVVRFWRSMTRRKWRGFRRVAVTETYEYASNPVRFKWRTHAS